MSCFYAKTHPECRVLVMDLAEEGDLTKRLLGGVDAAKEIIQEVCGGIFNLLADAEDKTKGFRNWLFAREVDITKHAIQVSQHNKNVPENLFLISSGAWPGSEDEMPAEQRKAVTDKIKESLQNSDATWKLFCDTDGDRRPSAMTKIGYSLCPFAIVPLHLNKADLDRTETMLGVMQCLRERGEIDTQVLFIIWNLVQSNADKPCEHKGNSLSFTPTKVNLDILDACNTRVCQLRRDLPGLFVHEEAADADFVKSSTCLCRRLADNVLKPAEELGRPFVNMTEELAATGKKTLKFQSGGVEYTADTKTIEAASDQLAELSRKFEAMSLSAPAGNGGYSGGQ